MKSRKWISVLLCALVLGVVCDRQVVEALGAQSELEKLSVRIEKFEVSYDGGTSYTTVFEGLSGYLDLTTGENAGDFFTGLPVPVGTINNVRVTIEGTPILKGKVTWNPLENPAPSDYFTTGTGADEETREAQGANYAEQAIDLEGTHVHIQDLIPGVEVVAGGKVTLRMLFDLAAAITCDEIDADPQPPWKYWVVPDEVTADVFQVPE